MNQLSAFRLQITKIGAAIITAGAFVIPLSASAYYQPSYYGYGGYGQAPSGYNYFLQPNQPDYLSPSYGYYGYGGNPAYYGSAPNFGPQAVQTDPYQVAYPYYINGVGSWVGQNFTPVTGYEVTFTQPYQPVLSPNTGSCAGPACSNSFMFPSYYTPQYGY